MGKKTKNNSKRLKTRHKKGIIKRKTAYSHVDKNLANVNDFVHQSLQKQKQAQTDLPKIEAESMSFDELKKLLVGPPVKKRITKLSVTDVNYLEPIIKKYGQNY